MRVALLSLHYAEYVTLLAEALAQTCEVLLVLNLENAEQELGKNWGDRLQVASLRVVALAKRRSPHGILANAWQVHREVRAFRPDIIHVQQGGVFDDIVPEVVLSRGGPMVLTVHDPRPHSGSGTRPLRDAILHFYDVLARNASTIFITHGDVLVQQIVDSEIRFRGRVFSVPHGPLGASSADLDDSWMTGSMLFFGRIQEYKGLAYFIEAVQQVAAKGIPILGVIAGTGPDLNNHRHSVSGSPLFRVHDAYISRAEVIDLFRDANVVVLPYTEASQSGVAAMALGFGRPVIASRVGAISEIVHDGVNGLLVPPRSSDALANAMVRLVTDVALAQRFARNAREMAAGVLSWRVIAAKTVEVYERALAVRGEDIMTDRGRQ